MFNKNWNQVFQVHSNGMRFIVMKTVQFSRNNNFRKLKEISGEFNTYLYFVGGDLKYIVLLLPVIMNGSSTLHSS